MRTSKASTAGCTMAIWHHPRFSSGEHGNDASVWPFWDALYRAKADVVVNGHDHDYERFGPQDPAGREDKAAGIREFVVGTGGAGLRDFPTVAAHSEIRIPSTFGVIRFVLHPTSYEWSFIATSGAVGRIREPARATEVSSPAMSAEQARVVVIGGGITGCSVAYHLALAGWTDVLLVEKAQLTAGSTCQAAGLVTAFNPSSTMMAFRRYSIELYRSLGAFETVGSLRLASSPEQLRELERTASRARGIGLDVEVIGADEARRLMPAISPDSLYGAVHLAGDGHLDPHGATHAVADAARALGVRIRTGRPRDRVRAVGPARDHGRPDRRRPDRHRARRQRRRDVGAAGRRDGRRRSSRRRRSTTSTSRLKAVPGSELPRDMPCFRDPDNLVYGKSEHGGMVFGGYELDPRSRWEDGVPWEHAAQSLPPDWERFAPLMAGAIRRFPFLADAEAIRLVCHPDAMTPDANPLLGPLPGGPRVLGRSRAVAQRLRGWGRDRPGDGRLDHGRRSGRGHRAVSGVAVRRCLPRPRVRRRAGAGDVLRLLPAPLPVRCGPRWTSATAVGAPRTPPGGRRGVRNEGRLGTRRLSRAGPAVATRRTRPGRVRLDPPAVVRAASVTEARAVRERAGIIDLSSFGKIAVEGPGALGLLQRVSANDIDRPGRERRLHAVVRRARRDGGGRDRHAPRG